MDTIGIEYQAKEVQLTRLDFACIAIEDQAMLLCRLHQVEIFWVAADSKSPGRFPAVDQTRDPVGWP